MGAGTSVFMALALFGALVAAVMLAILLWYRHNLQRHGDEVQRLLQLARSDRHHGSSQPDGMSNSPPENAP